MTDESRPETCGAGNTVANLCALEPGSHLIVLYRSDAERARAAAAFVVAGLLAGDRVLYVVGDRPLPAVRSALRASNAATEAAIDAGQLGVRRFADVYGATPGLDPAAAADRLRGTAARARADGFPGLRIAVEMDDHTRLLGPIEQVLAWERLATRLQHEEGITSVCQYDRQWLHPGHRRLLAAEHVGVAPGWVAPPQAGFLATPRGVRITGELDAANWAALSRVIEARLATTPRLDLDVAGMTFIDVGTLRRLYALAAGLPEGGHITLTRASPVLRALIGMLGWVHPRLSIDPAVDGWKR
ncbi:MEDS domain-containing protein [Couchioplanes azureus]|uniref:MEDS domain-containing protein n=1 Tax=Couchioplanes caeruleus TaxID=56438 RepID=UPI001670FC95|nr:MEDS domain-containing protein [Couchioplanes caeruleus]GGQ70011.1 hypothetical protein GCM10010166_44800 [Couchioplanes caeruleus subsp. azureus]